MKNKQSHTKQARFQVRVVYGFKNKLKIVLLGELISGTVEGKEQACLYLNPDVKAGQWPILEILHMDFVNQHQSENYKGIMLRCKDKHDFDLFQSLRVYDEIITLK